MDDPVGYWKKVEARQEKAVDWLKGKKQVHVTAPGTDLTLSIEGRPFINCACQVNVPDGEIFTSPVENSANGHVHFTYPTLYQGFEVDNVRLEFKDGKVGQSHRGKERGLSSSKNWIPTRARATWANLPSAPTKASTASPANPL